MQEVDKMTNALAIDEAPDGVEAGRDESGGAEWYLATDDGQVGPISIRDLEARATSGELDSESGFRSVRSKFASSTVRAPPSP